MTAPQMLSGGALLSSDFQNNLFPLCGKKGKNSCILGLKVQLKVAKFLFSLQV